MATESDTPEINDEGEGPGEPAAADEPRVWLVDGYNVLHAGLLGRDRTEWWTAERRNQLLDVAAGLDIVDAEIWLVFDGPYPEDEEPEDEEPENEEPEKEISGGDATPPPHVHRVFAPSADDWLLKRLRAEPNPSLAAIVTADRKVADRARHRGAVVVHPRVFLERCKK